MVTYGPWRNDSQPFWRDVGGGTTNSAGDYWVSESRGPKGGPWAPEADKAWQGTGILSGPGRSTGYNNMTFNSGAPDVGPYVGWTQMWTTLGRSDSLVDYGILPADVGYRSGSTWVFIDPNVVGVEWEDVPTPLDQRMTVTLGNQFQPLSSNEVQPGLPLSFVTRAPGNTFLTAQEVAGLDVLGTLTPATASDRPSVTFPLPANQAGTIVVSLVDNWTMTRIPPDEGGGATLKSHGIFSATWEGHYAPAYRLIYADPTRLRSYSRVVQRGSDGLGMTGGRRVVGGRSVQATNRRGAAFL